LREKEKIVNTAKVVKDDWFATKKWFIVLGDGFKVNTVGYKTKKSAVAMVEESGWTVVGEFEVK
jgi:hypothetical protein